MGSFIEEPDEGGVDLYENMMETSDPGKPVLSDNSGGIGSPSDPDRFEHEVNISSISSNSIESEKTQGIPPPDVQSAAFHNHVKYQCYVGNLTWWTSDGDIRKAVSDLGVLDMMAEVKFYENRNNGQSKGFCVVAVGSETSLKIIHECLPKIQIQGQSPIVKCYTKPSLAQLEAMALTRPSAGIGNSNSSNGNQNHCAGGIGIPMHMMDMGMTGMRVPMPHMEMNFNFGPRSGPRNGNAPGSPRGRRGIVPPGTGISPPRNPGFRGMRPNMSTNGQSQSIMGPGPGPHAHPVPGWSHNYPPMHGPGPRMPPMMFDSRFRGGGPGPQPHMGMGSKGPMQMHPMQINPMDPRGPGSSFMPPHRADFRPQIPPHHMQGPRVGGGPPSHSHLNPAFMHPGPGDFSGPPRGPGPYMSINDQKELPLPDYQPPVERVPIKAKPTSLTEAEFDDIMSRNRTVSSSAITRAVSDAAAGEYASAIETLVTAISLIKQSKVAYDDRCKILVSSLQDTLLGIENKSYGSGKLGPKDKTKGKDRERSRSRSAERDYRRRSRHDHDRTPDRHRDRTPERYRDYSRTRERSRSRGYRDEVRERESRDNVRVFFDDRYRDHDRRGSGGGEHDRRGSGGGEHDRRGSGGGEHDRRGSGGGEHDRRGSGGGEHDRRGSGGGEHDRRGSGGSERESTRSSKHESDLSREHGDPGDRDDLHVSRRIVMVHRQSHH